MNEGLILGKVVELLESGSLFWELGVRGYTER